MHKWLHFEYGGKHDATLSVSIPMILNHGHIPSFNKTNSHHLQGLENIRTQEKGKIYFNLNQDNANVATSAVKVFSLYWWKAESVHRPREQNLTVGPAQGRCEFLCYQQPQLPEHPNAQQATQKDNRKGTPK